jgi:hypothetical protein
VNTTPAEEREIHAILNQLERELESERREQARKKLASHFSLEKLSIRVAKLEPADRETMYRKFPQLKPKP